MPADPTAANSDDRSKLCLPLAASAHANGAGGRSVHTSPWSCTSLSFYPRDPSPRKLSAPGLDSEHRTVRFPAPRHRRKSR
jgi:hypothetical protein